MEKLLLLSLVWIGALSSLQCQTKDVSNAGTFVDDRDGQEYTWVNIGTKTWMAENLSFLPRINEPDKGSYRDNYYYVNGYYGTSLPWAKSANSYKTYGVLYNWSAALEVCPTGWHLPADLEWRILEKSLGMDQSNVDSYGMREERELGIKLKVSSEWKQGSKGNNSSSFSALPGGLRTYKGEFVPGGLWASFWSSTESGQEDAFGRYLMWDSDGVLRNAFYKNQGFSVRCVKD